MKPFGSSRCPRPVLERRPRGAEGQSVTDLAQAYGYLRGAVTTLVSAWGDTGLGRRFTEAIDRAEEIRNGVVIRIEKVEEAALPSPPGDES